MGLISLFMGLLKRIDSIIERLANRGKGDLHCQIVLHQHEGEGITIKVAHQNGMTQIIKMNGKGKVEILNAKKIFNNTPLPPFQTITMDLDEGVIITNNEKTFSQEISMKNDKTIYLCNLNHEGGGYQQLILDADNLTTYLSQTPKGKGNNFELKVDTKKVTTRFGSKDNNREKYTKITQDDKTIKFECTNFIVDALEKIDMKVQKEKKESNITIKSANSINVISKGEFTQTVKKDCKQEVEGKFTQTVKKDCTQNVTGQIKMESKTGFKTTVGGSNLEISSSQIEEKVGNSKVIVNGTGVSVDGVQNTVKGQAFDKIN